MGVFQTLLAGKEGQPAIVGAWAGRRPVETKARNASRIGDMFVKSSLWWGLLLEHEQFFDLNTRKDPEAANVLYVTFVQNTHYNVEAYCNKGYTWYVLCRDGRPDTGSTPYGWSRLSWYRHFIG